MKLLLLGVLFFLHFVASTSKRWDPNSEECANERKQKEVIWKIQIMDVAYSWLGEDHLR